MGKVVKYTRLERQICMCVCMNGSGQWHTDVWEGSDGLLGVAIVPGVSLSLGLANIVLEGVGGGRRIESTTNKQLLRKEYEILIFEKNEYSDTQ